MYTEKKERFWPGGLIPYMFHANDGDLSVSGSEETLETVVKEAMKVWEEALGVNFVPKKDYHQKFMLIVKTDGVNNVPNGGYHSGKGETNATDNKVSYAQGQTRTLNVPEGGHVILLGKDYTSLHEIGHILGFRHEQKRPDRDDHITLNWGSIEDGKDNSQFTKDDEGDGETWGDYDFVSNLHYPAPATGWGGAPSDEKVWTMSRKGETSDELGPEDWSELSELDRSEGRRAYFQVQPMGNEIDRRDISANKDVVESLRIGDKEYILTHVHRSGETNVWIREVKSDGMFGDILWQGEWNFHYDRVISYRRGGNTYIYGHSREREYSFIDRIRENGSGEETWNRKEAKQAGLCYLYINKTPHVWRQYDSGAWYLNELMEDGTRAACKDSGTYTNTYENTCSYCLQSEGGEWATFMYKHDNATKKWYVNRVSNGGEVMASRDSGTSDYEHILPFGWCCSNTNHQYLYRQERDGGKWWIRSIRRDGTLGDHIQSGCYENTYPHVAGIWGHRGNVKYYYGTGNDIQWTQRLHDLWPTGVYTEAF